jgi:thioesterase domain-containing protein
VVAHEVAVQLQAAGHEVEALVILDGYPAEQGPDTATDVTFGDFAAFLEAARIAIPDHGLRSMSDVFGALRDHGGVFADLTHEDLERLIRVVSNDKLIDHTHVPGVFAGRMLVVEAQEGRRPNAPSAEAWRPFIDGEIAAGHLPCTHLELCHPHMVEPVWRAMKNEFRL